MQINYEMNENIKLHDQEKHIQISKTQLLAEENSNLQKRLDELLLKNADLELMLTEFHEMKINNSTQTENLSNDSNSINASQLLLNFDSEKDIMSTKDDRIEHEGEETESQSLHVNLSDNDSESSFLSANDVDMNRCKSNDIIRNDDATSDSNFEESVKTRILKFENNPIREDSGLVQKIKVIFEN